MRFTRRDLLAGGASLAALGLLPGDAFAAAALGAGEPFSFERLVDRARAHSRRPHAAPVIARPEVLDRIDYDAYQQIRFRESQSLWRDEPGRWPLQLFHPGKYFKEPVRIHVVEDGTAREVLWSPDLFDYTGTAAPLRDEVKADGFAGFRLMGRDLAPDWLAFLGASYFRSSDPFGQYGLSARGLAIDVALPTPEEFPRFTGFWLEPHPDEPERVIIHALLESPRLTGAYRMDVSRAGACVMDIECRLFLREGVERLGVAPLTSMFWYGTINRHMATDWRPQIHDNEGLAIAMGSGETLWRPLANPPRVMTSSFIGPTPRGFGLIQRDREFAHYQDDGVFYDRRPSAWIAPRGDWGNGAVQLVEIPTDDEIYDNIVCYWTEAAPVPAGAERGYRYTLSWSDRQPDAETTARAVATRTGLGGVPGQRPRPQNSIKYAVDFEGGRLGEFGREDGVEVRVEGSRGQIANPYCLPVVGTERWRAIFDIEATGEQPVELRLFLSRDGEALTETWLYRHIPFSFG